ncbi:MAG TPA: cupin domain-containing protein [Woeseiaceae bacterium]|nr:cupin domain-containing protein [Woeseiaceae bacterium]
MKKVLLSVALLGAGMGIGAVLAAHHSPEHDVVLPAKISKEDMTGTIFERPDTITRTSGGNTIQDVTSLLSSDKKFASGMYKSGKVRFEATEPYGVDEFMYFLEGGVKLTSADGSVQVINAGEAVTIPKEWTGVWDTDGYTKIWVIYSEDGSGL